MQQILFLWLGFRWCDYEIIALQQEQCILMITVYIICRNRYVIFICYAQESVVMHTAMQEAKHSITSCFLISYIWVISCFEIAFLGGMRYSEFKACTKLIKSSFFTNWKARKFLTSTLISKLFELFYILLLSDRWKKSLIRDWSVDDVTLEDEHVATLAELKLAEDNSSASSSCCETGGMSSV